MMGGGYPMPELKTAALSPRISLANPAENAKQALKAIHNAVDAGAQAIVLPELYLSGCTCGDLYSQGLLLNACADALFWLAEQTKQLKSLIAIGLPIEIDGCLFNCAAVLQTGEILGLAAKRKLSRERGESRWFTAYSGEELTWRGIPVGQSLYSEVGIEIGECLSLQAKLILHLSAECELVGRHEKRRISIMRKSHELRCGYACAGAGAGESSTDLVFSGACIIAANGNILAESERFSLHGSAACADVELHLPSPAQLPALNEKQITSTPFVPSEPQRRKERFDEILNIQAAGLAQRLLYTGMRKIILGLSGGGDSTLALLVAIKTVDLLNAPRANILCVTMPGFGTTKYTRETAGALAQAFDVTLREIDIRPACEQHMRDINHDSDIHDITYENIQARQRTQILMNLANKEAALLLGTGCLSELALGWCTYNADHMSMYNLNGGLPKTLVKHLIAHVAHACPDEAAIALRRVTSTPISPELLPPDAQGNISQKTEDTLGPYEVHDFYLYYFYRKCFLPEQLHRMAVQAFSGAYSPAQLKQWLIVFLRRFFSQQFKRSCLPDGPRIGSVSLSPRGGWHMPSDASADLWLKRAENL